MSNDPAVLFYTSDFLTGTMTMSNEHVGMYIRLLCLQHQKGRLNKKDMLYICRTHVEDVYCKFKEENGLFYNERLEKESEKRKNYSESRRKNVLSRYSGKKKKKSTHVEHMEDVNEDINKDVIGKEKRLLREKQFNELWSKYPRKLGKDKALLHFIAQVKSKEDWQDINKALNNYLKSKNVIENSDYIQHGQTWFNKHWRDWIDYVEPIKPCELQPKDNSIDYTKQKGYKPLTKETMRKSF